MLMCELTKPSAPLKAWDFKIQEVTNSPKES